MCIKKHCNKLFSSILLFLCLTAICFGQNNNSSSENFEEIFGSQYKSAEDFIKNHPSLADTLLKYNINPLFAFSIVFPELIRYSALADIIESNNLKVLYVQFGKQYTDFSIGRFQMKPSFIETIERDYNNLLSDSVKKIFCTKTFNMTDSVQMRSARVARMNNLLWQTKYLAIFVLIMDKMYRNVKWKTDMEKLKFYATAYNTGYKKSKEKILKAENLKQFHIYPVFSAQSFNYSSISVYFFGNTKLLKNKSLNKE